MYVCVFVYVREHNRSCDARSAVDKMLTSMEEAASMSRDKLSSAMRRLSDASVAEVSEENSDRACVCVSRLPVVAA